MLLSMLGSILAMSTCTPTCMKAGGEGVSDGGVNGALCECELVNPEGVCAEVDAMPPRIDVVVSVIQAGMVICE